MTWMPQARRLDRVEMRIFVALDDDAAAGLRLLDAGDDLDQGRLAGAVLTDEAMHLAGLQVRSTSRSASTPPNRFEMPDRSRKGAPRVRPADGTVLSSNRVTGAGIPREAGNAGSTRRLLLGSF